MNKELFERLLYEEESTTLDFKKEQYRFARATDEEKSELIKDILGFANAWRRSEAYILIGVEDVRGGRSKVIGILPSNHLDDHSLQQFVNNLTNKPMRFHYEAFGFEGKQVGVIRIDQQTRPIYLNRNCGKLMKETVYVRRGSSTDPTKPASPSEIAQMGVSTDYHVAELSVEFAHVEREEAIGTNISWDAELCQMPQREQIPDLFQVNQRYPLGIHIPVVQIDPPIGLNHDYYRELADFEKARRLYRSARFVVRNTGQVAAKNVRVEMTVPTNIGVNLLEESDIPFVPQKRTEFLITPAQRIVGSVSRHYPGRVDIICNNERSRIEINCGDLQPGRRIWSDVFYIGKVTTGEFSLSGSVFADNLPQPKECTLYVSVTVAKRAMTVEELCSLPEIELSGK